LGQRGEVKPGAAGDDQAIARLQQARNLAQPVTDRICLSRAHMTIKPVRDLRRVLRVRAGRKDVPVRVDLQRIGIDDHPALRARDGQREGRFSGRRRPGYQDRAGRGDVVRDVHA
jgi:hypothetical protein